jgi:VWFA-related protein
MGMRGVGVSVLLIAASAIPAAQRPGDTPQFRAGIELIQLDVAVLDDQRQPVRGLTAQEFTVLDNGVATPLRAFTAIELDDGPRASAAVWARDQPPDVVTNRVGEQDGRLVVILMDRTIPVEQPTITARRIASAAVDALGPGDLAAVVSTSGGAIQNLTGDRARLLRAIDAGDPSTGISPEQEATFGKLDPLQDPRCACGLCVLETIMRVAEAVQDTPRRRKALLFIGTSMVWQASRPIAAAGSDVGCENRLRDARARMFAAVDRANLTVHSIDPQGLVNIGPQVRAGIGGGFDRPTNSGPEQRLRQQQVDTTQALTGQQSLQVLPERTGGRTVVGRNNPEQVVPAIFRESEAYYVLGIERSSSGRPDRERTIEVKVARRGLRAYTQRKYVPPPAAQPQPSGASVAGSSPWAEDALGRLLPSAALPLALYVNAFAAPDAATAVVRIGIDASAFAAADGRAVPLDVAVAAVDPTGRPKASVRQTSTIAGVAPASGGRGEFYVPSHLTLAPGEYGIRVAVSDPATGRVASVFSDLTVPSFDSARLSLSGLNVELATAPPAPPATTMRRLFRRPDTVRAVMQIYQGTRRTDPLAPVSVRVQILDARGSTVRDQTLPFATSAFANRRADCVITLPLAALQPGAYLLKLDVALERETIGRALRFAVE